MRQLDVRGLPPPEPFEHIVGALQTLSAGETLQVHIHRKPFPLYDVLRDNGYTWQTQAQADGNYLILIARAA